VGHTIKLDLPEDVYHSLVKDAEQAGQTPEELAVQYIAEGARHADGDPLDRFIGAFSSKIPGWSDRHDEYIGAEAMNDASDEGDSDA
jgi:hypothetical protein